MKLLRNQSIQTITYAPADFFVRVTWGIGARGKSSDKEKGVDRTYGCDYNVITKEVQGS